MQRSDDRGQALRTLIGKIASGDTAGALAMLAKSPSLALEAALTGATRAEAKPYFLDDIMHYVYAGDTALHIAAAAFRVEVAQELLARGADVRAKNRRGAEPLHYAVDGNPSAHTWSPKAQAAVVKCLLKAGADPNCVDVGGVTPLHRAVRNRCASAVRALLDAGADPCAKNSRGSTPVKLALQNSGRGGSGSAVAKAQQQEIVQLLKAHGAP